MSEALDLNQRTVLADNLRAVLETDLAKPYISNLRADASFHNYMAESSELFGDGDDPYEQRQLADEKLKSAGAELPFVFGFEPSNMARSVVMFRVDYQTGEKIEGSDVQIGLIDGLAGKGSPRAMAGFNAEQLARAVAQIKKQQEAGLVYGAQDY
jgi:hypothetical protein